MGTSENSRLVLWPHIIKNSWNFSYPYAWRFFFHFKNHQITWNPVKRHTIQDHIKVTNRIWAILCPWCLNQHFTFHQYLFRVSWPPKWADKNQKHQQSHGRNKILFLRNTMRFRKHIKKAEKGVKGYEERQFTCKSGSIEDLNFTGLSSMKINQPIV